LTPARVALGRTGASLTTEEVLRFQLAHAEARDAVHVPLDGEALAAAITALGCHAVRVETPATRRDVYLRRPDLGRRLEAVSAERLDKLRCGGCDIAIVIADGLSSRAVTGNAVSLLSRLIANFADAGLALAPVVIAEGARVALGDEIAERLGARLVIVLIGERPGLSSPDSLGAYLTYAPRRGVTDAERNCVSNIRAGGLDVESAASKLAWLATKALVARMTGVQLKDESGTSGLPLLVLGDSTS
jgi:ethanolamine ammonia-lyase small subunit